MRSKKRKKKASPPVKIEKNDDLCKYSDDESSKLPFAVGDEVLACWQDGLFYLAVVKTINTEKSKCQVTYEDDSVYWVWFKHIRTVATSKDSLMCSICETNESTHENGIVICDNCFHGYHPTCHIPVVDEQSMESEWLCRFCVFSKAAKAGGALKCGVYADALLAMKSNLPYDLNTLQWDAHHKCNTDEVYCYCAGPGLWYYKMLECQKCHQWFHEACLQCLDFPLLLGDRFYYFVCAVCNNGEEYRKRIQLKWTDIAALVLYNLSLKYHKRGFKNNDIEFFLSDNWNALQCGNLHDTPEAERMEKLIEVMKKQKRKFRCQSGGSGIVTWSLFIRCAPFPTKASLLHEAKLREDESGRTSKLLDCNGSCLRDDDIEDNSSTSNWVNHGSEAGTSESSTSDQTPLFPSLSMFKYLMPECGSRASESPDALSLCERYSDLCPMPGDKRPRSRDSADSSCLNEPIEKRFVNYVERLSNGVTSYAGTNGRLACGEDCKLLGRRFARNGRIEYLVQWTGVTPDSF